MYRIKYSTLCIATTLTIFSIVSKLIFDKIYETSKLVVDEEFHFSLGEPYCRFEFKNWNPKVTTFPGLYLLSSFLLGGFQLCSVYWLRFVSLIFSVINITLFYRFLNLSNREPAWKNIFSALNLGLLPPLYFFSHLYYTDVTSLTMVLLLFNAYQSGNHYIASIFGLLAVLFRQTNIVWVGMTAACYVLKEINSVVQKKNSREISNKEFLQMLNIFNGDLFKGLGKASLNFWLNTASYTSLLICFLVFVYINGSIVVGDKTAHKATIHLPQIFYFSLFCLFFAWPHFVIEVRSFINCAKRRLIIFFVITLLCLVIVRFNTLVHPYMLADNRHYVFYVWNRFYGRYNLFRYCMIPVYLFSLFVIISKMYKKADITFLLFFVPCTASVLITQRLLELRYFFVPYVLFRMQIKEVSSLTLICEFLTHIIINAVTLYVFLTKTIDWPDFDLPQRLIW